LQPRSYGFGRRKTAFQPSRSRRFKQALMNLNKTCNKAYMNLGVDHFSNIRFKFKKWNSFFQNEAVWV